MTRSPVTHRATGLLRLLEQGLMHVRAQPWPLTVLLAPASGLLPLAA